jgi:hypothetical protein
MEEECHEVAVFDCSVVNISIELSMARKVQKRRPPHTPRRGVLVGRGPQNVRLLQFVLDPLGPDSIVLTEGSILRMEVTSIIIKGGPDRRVAGARRLTYVTGYNRLV